MTCFQDWQKSCQTVSFSFQEKKEWRDDSLQLMWTPTFSWGNFYFHEWDFFCFGGITSRQRNLLASSSSSLQKIWRRRQVFRQNFMGERETTTEALFSGRKTAPTPRDFNSQNSRLSRIPQPRLKLRARNKRCALGTIFRCIITQITQMSVGFGVIWRRCIHQIGLAASNLFTRITVGNSEKKVS